MNTENESVFRAVQTNPEIGDRGFIHIYDADISAPGPYVLGIHGGQKRGRRNGVGPYN
jgi:hypothetical protein